MLGLFASDRQNYSCYLTVHYYELLRVETNFPEILEQFENGNFSVQMSTGNPFGRMEPYKVIETTIDRGTKTPGETTGMFHSLKNQNTLVVEIICGRNFCEILIYIFFNLKLTIDCITFLTAQLKHLSIDNVLSLFYMLL